MSTYLELQTRIANDYLNRSTLGDPIRRSILAAVRHHERQNWGFNETSTALTTSSGQAFVSFPSNLLVLHDLRITISGEKLQLNRRDSQYIREMNVASATGQPTDFAIYQNRAELAIIPNSAWSVSSYYVKSLSALSADSDTNAWTQGVMQDVIVYHATKIVWANVLRNEKEAVKYAALERAALSIASGENEQQRFHGIKPTSF